MRFSNLTSQLAPESVDAWSIHARARQMQADGHDIILLSIGDPDFDTPGPIVDSAIKSLHDGRTHYSSAAGIDALRDAIADHQHERTGLEDLSRDNVIVAPGAQCALFATAMCVLGNGQTAVIPEPMYVTYDGVVAATGATIVPVGLHPENDFHLDPDEVSAAVRPDTRAIIINTPHNPTGTVMRPETIAELGVICEKNDLWLICDEVYCDVTFEHDHVSPMTDPRLRHRTAGIYSLSKGYAMTGWRIGWVVGPPALIEHIELLLSCMLFGAPTFIQDAAVAALSTELAEVATMRAAYWERRDLVCDLLAPANKLHCHRPEAGMYVMIDVRATGMDGKAFANALLDAEGVSLLPGEGFGASGVGHVRFSTCESPAVLEEACRRLLRFTASL